MSTTHELHASGDQIKAALALLAEVADTTGPLAEAAANLVADIDAAQFDRDPMTWGIETGQRHFRDTAGRRIPNRYVRELCESDPKIAEWLQAKIAGAHCPDDISELDDTE